MTEDCPSPAAALFARAVMAAMLALVLLALPLQAAAFTASPIAPIPANCGTRAVTNPIPPGCLGQSGTIPTGWTCPTQPGSANGAHSHATGRLCESVLPQAYGVSLFLLPQKNNYLTRCAPACALTSRHVCAGGMFFDVMNMSPNPVIITGFQTLLPATYSSCTISTCPGGFCTPSSACPSGTCLAGYPYYSGGLPCTGNSFPFQARTHSANMCEAGPYTLTHSPSPLGALPSQTRQLRELHRLRARLFFCYKRDEQLLQRWPRPVWHHGCSHTWAVLHEQRQPAERHCVC